MELNIKKFDDKATNYSLYRPKYPNELIDYLIETTGITKEDIIVDVGCGTGILTKQLLDHNTKVIGVEPNLNMYKEAIKTLKGYECSLINSSAENIALSDNMASMVTVAQSLHWFDLDKFIKEYTRILKPEGYVAILYNNMVKGDEVVDKFLDVHRTLCPNYKSLGVSVNNLYEKMFSNGYESLTYDNNQILSYIEYIGYIKSLSYSLTKDDPKYTEYINLLNDIFNKFKSNDKIKLLTKTTLVIGKITK